MRHHCCTLVLLTTVTCWGLNVSPPKRGEVGYKRYRAKEAVRTVIRELRRQDTVELPHVLSDESALEEERGHVELAAPLREIRPLGPIGDAPWGTGVPREIEAACSVMCDAAEQEALLTLKRAVSPWIPERRDVDFVEAVHGDIRLLRFLRKYKEPLLASEEYIRMIAWRASMGVDSALRVEQGCNNTAFKHHSVLYRLMPVDVTVHWADATIADGQTSSNRSSHSSHQRDGMMQMELGRWDTHGLVKAVEDGLLTENDFLQYWIQVNEMLSLSLDGVSRADGELAFFRIVCDFEQTSWRQFSRPFLDLMKLWAKISDYYPYTSREIFFLNTPRFFGVLWRFIQPVLNDDTKSKIWLVPKGTSEATRVANLGE